MTFNADAGASARGAADEAAPSAMAPAPTNPGGLPVTLELFSPFTDALDYAGRGDAGYNFYNLRGGLSAVLSYSDLVSRARLLARRMAARFPRGSRIALVAETSPEFLTAFFACQYAGLVPAPMPLPVNLGGKDGYLTQVRLMVDGALPIAGGIVGAGSDEIRWPRATRPGGRTLPERSCRTAAPPGSTEQEPS